MSKKTKILINSFLISGIVFAGINAGFDYFSGQEFSVFKFIFNFSFFGLSMGLIARNNYKKQIEKEEHSKIQKIE